MEFLCVFLTCRFVSVWLFRYLAMSFPGYARKSYQAWRAGSRSPGQLQAGRVGSRPEGR